MTRFVRQITATLTFVFGAFVLIAPAYAHVRSESHSVWEINGTRVDLIFSVANIELQRITKDGSIPTDAAAETYLTPKLYPAAGAKRCTLAPPIVTPSAAPGFKKFDFTFNCANPNNIAIHTDAFYDVVPTHTNFAQIQNTNGDFAEELLTTDGGRRTSPQKKIRRCRPPACSIS